MRAIINGFRYDTERAILVGAASHGMSGDFSHWEAELYVTPRARRYFLAGDGGPMTRWARQTSDGGTTSGYGIIPLSDNQAYEWAEQHLSTEEVEEHFADMIEDA